MSLNNMVDKVALITGSCRGIGRACAEAFANNGCKYIAICCRQKHHIEKTAEEIGDRFKTTTVLPFACDISNYNEVNNMIDSIFQTTGKIDILVVNTGTPKSGSFSQCSIDDWTIGIDLCLNSAIYLCQRVIPSMKERKYGKIIFLTSIYAKEPDYNFVISSTIRAGLLSLSKCLAGELAPFNINVNAICQGYTDTPLLQEVAQRQSVLLNKKAEDILYDWKKGIPLGRFATPEEIGNLVVFLASEQASYITGTAVTIDGGVVKNIF